MPIVPRGNLSFVPTEPRPIIRPPTSAFEPSQPIDLSPLTNQVSKIMDEEQQKKDAYSLIGADAQLAQLHNSLLYDPTNGVLNKKGFDAGPASQQAIQDFQKGQSDIAATLSPNQQLSFQKIASRRFEDFDNSLADHARTEIARGKAETVQANLNAEQTATLQAYNNPERVAQGIENTKNVIALDGHLNGESPEVIAQRMTDAVSKIHMGVINLLLADDRDIDATKYFQAHSGELDAQSLLRAKDTLDTGSLRGESQRRADTIVQQSATLGGALQQAAKITDPKLREKTEDRIRRHFEDVNAGDRFDRQQAYERASAIIAKTGDINQVPPETMQKLSASEQIELQHLENLKRNPPRVTNWDTYAKLLNMAGLNDSTRQQFEQLDLTKYRGQLSDEHYQHLLTLQLGERRQTGGAIASESRRQAAVQDKAQAAAAKRDAAAQTLRSMGIDVPQSPSVPGMPLRTQATPLKLSPNGRQIPQTWVDRASKNPDTRHYYEHMGVIFDTTASKPAALPRTNNPANAGNSILK